MDNVIIDDNFLIMEDYIDTDIGRCYLITLQDYKNFSKYQFLLGLQKFQIERQILKLAKACDNNTKEQYLNLYKEIKKLSYLDIIRCNILDLYNMYSQLFFMCFKCDVFNKINTDEELEYYLELISKVNNLSINKENPNPEIEKFKRMERELKNINAPKIEFKHIYTSVWTYLGGHRPPNDMTLYAFFSLFDQISMFKNYDATTIYRSVGADIKDNPFWCGELEHKASEIDEKDFIDKSNSLFS